MSTKRTQNPRWLPWLTLGLLLPTFTACQSTSTRISSEWRDPALATQPFQRLIVVAMEPRPGLRRVLEDEFVRQLGAAGVTAQASYPDARFSLDAIDADRAAATAAMLKLGADGVLMVRLMDERTIKRYVGQAPPRMAYTPNQFDPAVPARSWSEFYHSSYLEAGRTYEEQVDRSVSVESLLYALDGEALRWSALTETFVQHGANQDAKVRAFVATLVARLQQAGAFGPAKAGTAGTPPPTGVSGK